MKGKQEILYDDYYDREREENTRQELFDTNAEDEGWASVEDVPDDRVDSAIYSENQWMWDDFKYALVRLLKDTPCLLVGTCGRWDGPASAGSFIRDISDLRRGLSHLDYLKVYDVGGHLYIEGSHHDGSDFYEIKKLTGKGRQLAESNHYAHDRRLHQVLMGSNLFTGLPHLAEAIRGWAG